MLRCDVVPNKLKDFDFLRDHFSDLAKIISQIVEAFVDDRYRKHSLGNCLVTGVHTGCLIWNLALPVALFLVSD